jgi:hypothetical protein
VSIGYLTGALSARLGGSVVVSQGQDMFLHAVAFGPSRRLYVAREAFRPQLWAVGDER